MHLYTIQEVCTIALRLRDQGMGLKHAVMLTASAYGFQPDDIFIELSKMDPLNI